MSSSDWGGPSVMTFPCETHEGTMLLDTLSQLIRGLQAFL